METITYTASVVAIQVDRRNDVSDELSQLQEQIKQLKKESDRQKEKVKRLDQLKTESDSQKSQIQKLVQENKKLKENAKEKEEEMIYQQSEHTNAMQEKCKQVASSAAAPKVLIFLMSFALHQLLMSNHISLLSLFQQAKVTLSHPLLLMRQLFLPTHRFLLSLLFHQAKSAQEKVILILSFPCFPPVASANSHILSFLFNRRM